MTDQTPTPLPPQREAEYRTAELLATKGPWGLYDDGTGRYDIAADLTETEHGYRWRRGIAQLDTEPIDNDPAHTDWTDDEDAEQVRSDAEFIALAREAVPALLAELDRVRAERNEFCDRVDTLTAVAQGNKRHVQSLFAELQTAQRERAEARSQVAELKKQAATATEYGIRISGGRVLGRSTDRAESLARLGRARDAWPDAVLVQRSVAYGEWTES